MSNFNIETVGTWTKDRVALLLKLNSEGKSGSEMSQALQLGSRSAVIGKLNRMGVAMGNCRAVVRVRRANGETETARPRPRGKTRIYQNGYRTLSPEEKLNQKSRSHATAEEFRAGLADREHAELTELPPDDASQAVSFMGLANQHCRWPLGNPHELATFRYCGRQRAEDHSYCPGHCRIAYQRPHR
jgi:GcrA cell cycle regulator